MNKKVIVTGLMVFLFTINMNGEGYVQQDLIKAEVKPYKGTPMLFINGKVTAPLFFFDNMGGWGDHNLAIKELQLANKYNIRLHEIGFPACLSWKDKDGKYNYDVFDKSMKEVLDNDPQALIILRFWIAESNYDLWQKQNPDELMEFSDGSKWSASIASKKFLNEVCDNIKALAEHIEKSSYVNNIIGYHPNYLACGEMFYPFCQPGDNAYQVGDYSKPMQLAFREYVKNKYKTESALQKAWKDNNITFDKVKVPDIKDRAKSDIGNFRTDINGPYITDFYECYNGVVAGAIIQMGKTIKESTNNRCLSVFFYGYLFELARNFSTGVQNSGHCALRKVLDSPYVDALAGPLSYHGRDSKDTDGSYFMTVADSIQLHNKLWINEDDTRTHLAANESLKSCNTLDDTIQAVRRSFNSMITHSASCWWMDLPGAGWWAQDEIFAELQKLTGIYNKWLEETNDCSYKPEVAVILDEKSAYTMSFDNRLMCKLMSLSRPALTQMGAPCGYYLMSDLADGLVPKGIKLYIFLNAFNVSEKERKYIDENLKKDNKTLVWMYAPGFLKDGIADVKNMYDLTGIHLEMKQGEYSSLTQVVTNSHPILQNVYVFFGDMFFKTNPMFFSTDKETVMLGQYQDNFTGTVQPAFVLKENGNWNSIFIGSPDTNLNDGRTPILYNLCKYAKVHTYIDTPDRIFANKNMVGIYNLSSGKKVVSLPKKCTVVKAFTGEIIGTNIDKFEVDSVKYQTELYLLK